MSEISTDYIVVQAKSELKLSEWNSQNLIGNIFFNIFYKISIKKSFIKNIIIDQSVYKMINLHVFQSLKPTINIFIFMINNKEFE